MRERKFGWNGPTNVWRQTTKHDCEFAIRCRSFIEFVSCRVVRVSDTKIRRTCNWENLHQNGEAKIVRVHEMIFVRAALTEGAKERATKVKKKKNENRRICCRAKYLLNSFSVGAGRACDDWLSRWPRVSDTDTKALTCQYRINDIDANDCDHAEYTHRTVTNTCFLLVFLFLPAFAVISVQRRNDMCQPRCDNTGTNIDFPGVDSFTHRCLQIWRWHKAIKT